VGKDLVKALLEQRDSLLLCGMMGTGKVRRMAA